MKEAKPIESVSEERQSIYGYEIATNVVSFDSLIGQVFTHTELLGLSDRQLTALKSSLRKMFWEWYNRHLDNPSGLSDPSHVARVEAGIDPLTTSTSGPVYVSATQ